MVKKKVFWTSDKIVASVAMFISILTLFIFVRQTNIMETQSHLSVMPYLTLETSNNGKNKTFSIDLVNHGLGPAFIERYHIMYKGKSYEMQFVDFLHENIPSMDSVIATNYTSIDVGQAIRSGDFNNIVTIGGGETSYTTFLEIFKKLQNEKFDYEILYKSIYGHRWKITSTSEVPEQME